MQNDLKPICIYGTGFRAKFLYHYLSNKGRKIYAFVTTGKEDIDVLYQKPVKQIWDVAEETDLCSFTFVLAVQEAYWAEIRKVLEALGAFPENICCADYKSMLADEKIAEIMIKDTEIYRRLQDEKSRIIWGQGVKYRLTNDYSFFLKDIGKYFEPEDCLQYENSNNLAEWLAKGCHKERKKTGVYAPSNFWINFTCLRLLEMGVTIDCICTEDEKMYRRLAYGIPVVPLAYGANYLKDGYLIVGSGRKQYTEETEERLRSCGFTADNIVLPCSEIQPFAYGKQYFDLQALERQEDEVFVDAGCLDCTTDLDFVEWCQGSYKHIYAFEPDAKSYEKCVNIAGEKGIQKLTIVNKGLWEGTARLGFGHNNSNLALSKIEEKGEDEIETVALDDFLEGERVSFIKMDIEGAELSALKGAENTIKMYKPRLAISIYHKVNDFIDIPEYLLSIVPEYKFYVRHYSCYKFETVLYALI